MTTRRQKTRIACMSFYYLVIAGIGGFGGHEIGDYYDEKASKRDFKNFVRIYDKWITENEEKVYDLKNLEPELIKDHCSHQEKIDEYQEEIDHFQETKEEAIENPGDFKENGYRVGLTIGLAWLGLFSLITGETYSRRISQFSRNIVDSCESGYNRIANKLNPHRRYRL